MSDVVIVAPAEITYQVHEPYRDVLACRPTPAGTDAVAAVQTFAHLGEAARLARWIEAGRPAGEGNPTGGGRVWITGEVRDIRYRTHVREVRRKAEAIARRRDLREPQPYRDEHELDADYGRRCVRVGSRREGYRRPGPIDDADCMQEYGRRIRRRWNSVYEAADEDCTWRVLGGGRLECARERVKLPKGHEYWTLVADRRPVVIAAESGRLIDGLQRILAHRLAGDRSPGIPVEYREYDNDSAAELEDVCRLNASHPDMPPLAAVQIASAMIPHYRREAARNSGQSRYREPEWSSDMPAYGRHGRRRKAPLPRRVSDRLAALCDMRRPTFEHWYSCYLSEVAHVQGME